MTTMTELPRDREWTVDDLALLPDDGLQYELVDGVLLVSPAPVPQHQRVSRALFRLLDAAAPADLEVFYAPVDYQPTRRRSLQPDLLVVRREDVGETRLTRPLLLAVEVLSRGSRTKDLLLKRGVYEESGVATHWVVDPEEPSLLVLELHDGRYAEAARVVGEQAYAATRPFPISVRPVDLLAG
ncbi:Uma2 family endonuclease [soil metagenome]